MASYSDDFDYTGELDANGYTLAGFDPGIVANGTVATADGIHSFALVEMDSDAHTSTITVNVATGGNAWCVVCSDLGYSFPDLNGYKLEIVDPFSSDTWFWRLFRHDSAEISHQGIAGTMPFTLELSHDGAGNVDITIDGVLIDTYVDGSPLTGLWAGFGTFTAGTTFDDFAAADAGGGATEHELTASGSSSSSGSLAVTISPPTSLSAGGSSSSSGALNLVALRTISAAGSSSSGGAVDVRLAGYGVWEQIAPAGVSLDPDDPLPNSNYGFQSIALAGDGTLYVTKDHEGLYRSTNDGTTWSHHSTDGDLETGSPWTLQVDPFDDSVLWSNSGYGVGGPLKSVDGGQTWTFIDVGAPTQAGDVYSIALDPFLEDHVLVAWHSTWVSSAASGISESFDGGDTWTNHAPPTEDWGTGHAVFILTDSDTWLVTTQVDGVWRTDDGGDTWTQVETEPMTHGATDCLTAVGSTLFLALEHHIRQSDDNGETWTDITGVLPGDYWSNVATDGTNLYTAPSFPVAGSYIAGPWYSRPVAGGTWEEMTDSPDTTLGANSNGPRQSVSRPGYVFTSNYLGGVWRLTVALVALELSSAGNSQSDGALAVAALRAISAAGAGTSDGAAALTAQRAISAAGSSSSSGALAVVREIPITAAGSSSSSGSVDAEITSGPASLEISAAGNSQSGGSLTVVALRTLAAGGSSSSTGSAAITAQRGISAAGSSSSSGSATVGTSARIAASGSSSSSGGVSMSVETGEESLALSAAGNSQSAGALELVAVYAPVLAGSSSSTGALAMSAQRSLSAAGSSSSGGHLSMAILIPVGALVFLLAPHARGAVPDRTVYGAVRPVIRGRMST